MEDLEVMRNNIKRLVDSTQDSFTLAIIYRFIKRYIEGRKEAP